MPGFFGGIGVTSGSGSSWLKDDQSVSESGIPDATLSGLAGFGFMGGPLSINPRFFLGEGRFTSAISGGPGLSISGSNNVTCFVFLQQQYIKSKASKRSKTITIRHQMRAVSFSTFNLIVRSSRNKILELPTGKRMSGGGSRI